MSSGLKWACDPGHCLLTTILDLDLIYFIKYFVILTWKIIVRGIIELLEMFYLKRDIFYMLLLGLP